MSHQKAHDCNHSHDNSSSPTYGEFDDESMCNGLSLLLNDDDRHKHSADFMGVFDGCGDRSAVNNLSTNESAHFNGSSASLLLLQGIEVRAKSFVQILKVINPYESITNYTLLFQTSCLPIESDSLETDSEDEDEVKEYLLTYSFHFHLTSMTTID